MFIRTKVQRLIHNRVVRFHDAAGERVPSETVVREYQGIRAYLLAEMQPGEIVGINLPYDYRYLLGILACMEVGLPYLPLRPTWPTARIAQIKALAGLKHVVDQENIEAICRHPVDADASLFPITPESPLYIIYTSGTTGAPKGVVIPRRAYENFLKWINAELRLGPDNRMLLTAHFTFDVSLHDIAHCLLDECACYFSQFEGNLFQLAYEIETYEIASIATVPNNINLLLQDDIFERSDLRSLRHILLAGSRLMIGTYRNILERLPDVRNLYNLYGPTEATIYCLFKKLSGADAHDVVDSNVSIGLPAPGMTSILVDGGNRIIDQAHQRGELLVGGAQVMTGYLGDPERTNHCLTTIDHVTYYRTGDVAFRDDKGDYYVTGRNDDTLKRRGYRVNLLDIDSYIQKIAAVQDCVTVAVPEPNVDHVLVTYVVPRRPVSEAELRRELDQHLVEYQVPDHIFFIDGFPLSNSGKIDKEVLRGRFLAGLAKAS